MKTNLHQPLRNTVCIACLGWAVLFVPAPGIGQTIAPATTALGAFSQSLQGPVRVAANAAGRIYVTDRSAGQVLVVDAFGRAMSSKPGLTLPLAVAVDAAGRIYVGEEKKGSVSVFDANWNPLFQLGQGDGEFALPGHIAIDPVSGTAYVCDSGANQIKLYRDGRPVSTFGGYGSAAGQFDFPAGVWVSPAGEVFVVDQNNARVQVFDLGGIFRRQFSLNTASGSGSGPSGRFQGVAGDSSGRIYVADTFQGQVQVFDAQGNFLSTIGSYGEGRGQFRSPVSLAADAYGRLVVASANNSRLELLGLDGYIQLAANPASQLVAAGTRATFSVSVASPGPFTYQWRRGTNNLTDMDGITGATSPTLILAATTTNDTGAYSVVVTGPSGSFTSPDAALTVLTPPTIISHPASQTVEAGTTALFSVSAHGDSLGYQWQLEGAAISGATGRFLSVSSSQPSDAGRYSVVVSNLVAAVVSDPALLTVFIQPAPPQLDSLSSFLPDGSLRLFFHGDAGFNYAIEASADLTGWEPLATVFSADGTVEYFDADAAANSLRFYRVRWLP
jgi:DNA-binding beta-propeller fold protein YncE